MKPVAEKFEGGGMEYESVGMLGPRPAPLPCWGSPCLLRDMVKMSGLGLGNGRPESFLFKIIIMMIIITIL